MEAVFIAVGFLILVIGLIQTLPLSSPKEYFLGVGLIVVGCGFMIAAFVLSVVRG